MEHKLAKTLILEICSVTGAKPYAGYSGRGMYGKMCWGIKCDADNIHEVQVEARRRGINHDRRDQLGKGYIVYWPDLKYDIDQNPAIPLKETSLAELTKSLKGR